MNATTGPASRQRARLEIARARLALLGPERPEDDLGRRGRRQFLLETIAELEAVVGTTVAPPVEDDFAQPPGLPDGRRLPVDYKSLAAGEGRDR